MRTKWIPSKSWGFFPIFHHHRETTLPNLLFIWVLSLFFFCFFWDEMGFPFFFDKKWAFLLLLRLRTQTKYMNDVTPNNEPHIVPLKLRGFLLLTRWWSNHASILLAVITILSTYYLLIDLKSPGICVVDVSVFDQNKSQIEKENLHYAQLALILLTFYCACTWKCNWSCHA